LDRLRSAHWTAANGRGSTSQSNLRLSIRKVLERIADLVRSGGAVDRRTPTLARTSTGPSRMIRPSLAALAIAGVNHIDASPRMPVPSVPERPT
jgi:hypothetical protein